MRVLIIHFRSGPGVHNTKEATIDAGESAGTDGVSLEMAKRAKLLAEMGHEVAISSAYDWADISIPELEFEREEVVDLMRGLFSPAQRGAATQDELKATTLTWVERLHERFRAKIGGYHPDLIFVHNIFSLPIHPSASVALADYVRESGVPCAAIHHDVRSEGAYKFTPTGYFARRLLVDYFPPEMSNLRHWSINSRDRRFFRERGFAAEVIHDTLDYGEQLESSVRTTKRARIRELAGIGRDDIVLLLSTRIVPNKQAEIAGFVAREMVRTMGSFVGRTLYNGVRVAEDSRVLLLLAGRPERAFHWYRDAVFDLYGDLKIAWKYVGDSVMPRADDRSHHFALYPDCYAAADFALYPTRWEGFGNQFLEITASRLPAAVYQYPVFKEDIAPLGFDVVSLGDIAEPPQGESRLRTIPAQTLSAAAKEIWGILTDPQRYRDIVDRNHDLGARNFGIPVLREHLTDVVAWARDIGRDGTARKAGSGS